MYTVFALLCFVVLIQYFPISIRLTSLALWQSNDCPSASKATLMNMDKYFMWIHYERLHNHNKAKHNKTVCIFLGIYCIGRHYVAVRVFVLRKRTDRPHHRIYHKFGKYWNSWYTTWCSPWELRTSYTWLCLFCTALCKISFWWWPPGDYGPNACKGPILLQICHLQFKSNEMLSLLPSI